jgi:hypothetical protein
MIVVLNALSKFEIRLLAVRFCATGPVASIMPVAASLEVKIRNHRAAVHRAFFRRLTGHARYNRFGVARACGGATADSLRK